MLPPEILHLPFAAGAPRGMGLAALSEADWIEIDDAVPAQRAQRAALIAHERDAVIAALPGTVPMQAELLDLVLAHLRRWQPDWPHDPTGESDPLAALGNLVAEDFCLLRETEAGPVLVAAVLCFPARWRLAEKLGRTLTAVHQPVPSYGAHLAQPVERFLSTLRPGRIAWRLNWSVIDDPALFQPFPAAPVPGITRHDAGSRLFLRVERQTFRRLPQSGAIVFGIRTHVTTLEKLAGHGDVAARLAAEIRALSEAMQDYKALLGFRPALLAYLDGAGAPPRITQAVFGGGAYHKMLALRRRVLRIPLGLDYSAEQLAHESDNLHLALWHRDAVAGTLLVVPPDRSGTAKLRQVAVDPACERLGFGRALVCHAEGMLQRLGAACIVLAAREEVVGFYERLGYEAEGERFTEVTLPHRRMRKRLALKR